MKYAPVIVAMVAGIPMAKAILSPVLSPLGLFMLDSGEAVADAGALVEELEVVPDDEVCRNSDLIDGESEGTVDEVGVED